ncbi:hypothetical protein TrispH2_007089 [Trichoplax sp. H2]|nr:hypothetical protein TrispH2_007089 [Trichoplax sp. H2]|eukprot:RDD40553.1 hypothetical protein TrispH2_007089 [Trichoplax sp. H2]
MAEEEATFRVQKRFNEYDDGQAITKKNRLEQEYGQFAMKILEAEVDSILCLLQLANATSIVDPSS